jgi:Uma2 family endonuclease
MLDLGLFEGKRFELIDGELIDKMGQKPRHAFAIRCLAAWLATLFGFKNVLVQSPIQLAGGERDLNLPEPDLAVVQEHRSNHEDQFPGADEVVLVVEVADSSLRTDRTVKRGLYARAGIPEYWILDVASKNLIVHRNPLRGDYDNVAEIGTDQPLFPHGMPGAATTLRDLLS